MSPRERRLAALVTAQRDEIQSSLYAAWAAQQSTDPREIVQAKLRIEQLMHALNACEAALRDDDSLPVSAGDVSATSG